MALIKTSILFFLLAFLACKKEKNCTSPIGITGEWTWEKSIGGIGGWTKTPESEHLTRRLVIDEFYYQEFMNDSLVLKKQYDVGITDKTQIGTEERTYIELDSGDMYAYMLKGDELILYEQCYDCFEHRYKRK